MNSSELKNLSTEDAMTYIIDNHQDRMCELCERYILGCSHNTITFQCEGSKCDVALDYIMEELIDNTEADEKKYFETYSPLLINRSS